MSIPVLGVPAGCKIHSGVYAITPQAAGRVVKQVIQGQLVNVHEAQVMDIDEQLFRQGKVKAKPYGDMLVPSELQYVQAVKMGGKESDELVLDDIAAYIIETMQEYPEHIFVMGSGSTVAHIMQSLGLENTLLGVDLVQNEDLLASDVTSEQLLAYTLEQPTKLIITLIGGQGHILGRGNQQLSPEFIRRVGKQNILLVATKAKLSSLASRPLIVDSGDLALNQELSGLITVHTGYRDQVLYQVTG
jgi:predicted polyphosphate/ATP-dependent NAD kinase